MRTYTDVTRYNLRNSYVGIYVQNLWTKKVEVRDPPQDIFFFGVGKGARAVRDAST